MKYFFMLILILYLFEIKSQHNFYKPKKINIIRKKSDLFLFSFSIMKYIPLFNEENSHKLSEVKNIRGLEEKKINTLEHSTRDKLSALLDFDKLSDQTHAILKAHAKSLSQRFKNAISGHH